ncbi:LysR family transcriptional regulator [Marinobacterium mangrovicola]|uniref:DNA-binding transcriptional LysR family regulator n=1 Tax=Marinobacterium mangrovicola TaxID=1476959 RepID=A0A4R1GWE7_9GAMM|nr:LysR family transcriptional regulator [Marinobacterium mangrovicola]TCK08742.1 DNA-binding transcriptional LysR family regulator [Marinobacterium mangrovicola]
MSQSLPSLNALRAFDEAARTLSVSRAAEQLSVTHGAVSRQIRQLEEQLGISLFRREGRGLALTTEGEQLRATTSQVFDQLVQTCDQLKKAAVDAPLVLGCSGSFLARWFIPRLDRMQRQCPDLKLHLTASDDLGWPLPAQVNLALRFAEPPWPKGAQVIDLAPERMGPVLRPDLLPPEFQSESDRLAPELLTELPLLHTRSRQQAWPLWLQDKGLDRAERSDDKSFDHLNYMLEAALVGLGVAIAPAYLVEEDLRTGRLIAPWGFIETPARLGLWLPQGELSAGVKQLVSWLNDELRLK